MSIAEIKRIDPKSFNDLDAECKNFWTVVQRAYETDKKIKCTSWTDQKVKNFIKSVALVERHDTVKNKIEITECESNTIMFKVWGGNNVSRNFIRNLRDASAHNLVEKDSKTGELHFQNWSKRNGKEKCTMNGRMKFDYLKQLVTILVPSINFNTKNN